MADVSAQEILDICLSERGDKTYRLNQIADICYAALKTDAVSAEPTNVAPITGGRSASVRKGEKRGE